MLVDLEALLGLVSRDELDLGVREPLGRQEGQPLMAEQVRMHGLRDIRLLAIWLHDLLDAASRERSESPSFKSISGTGLLLKIAFEN
jgi:hypothetical protein